MFHRMLVPLDGSHPAAQAVPYAITLSRAFNAPITLLGIVEPATVLGIVPLREGTPAIVTDLSEEPRVTASTDYLASIATAIRAHDASAMVVVRRGNPAAEITACAEEEPGTLVVLTSHGRSGPRPEHLGSVTQHVVRHATTPTLVVRPHPDLPAVGEASIRGITVTLDGSLLSEAAVPVAATLAARLAVPLTLLRVIPQRPYRAFYALEGPDAPPVEEIEATEEAEAAQYLTGIATRLRAEQMRVHTVWRRSARQHVDETIVARVTPHADGILVMASHGRGGVVRWALGSTTEAVLAHAPCAVLIVRADAVAPPA